MKLPFAQSLFKMDAITRSTNRRRQNKSHQEKSPKDLWLFLRGNGGKLGDCSAQVERIQGIGVKRLSMLSCINVHLM